MKKYAPSLIASSIVLSIAFLQCTSPATTNPKVTTQKDAAMSMNTTELKSIDKPASIDEPKSIDKPAPVDAPKPIDKPASVDAPKSIDKPAPVDVPKSIGKPAPVDAPKSVDKPAPVDAPKSIGEPAPIDAPKSIDKPTPVDEPASLTSTGFTMKSLKATIKGTSTLHDWESQVTEIEGKGSFQMKDKLLATIQDTEIKIAVKGIKSTEGKKMDKKTYEAFKSDENPFIIYSFSNAVVKISASNDVTIEATGNLSMAGTSEPVSLSANGKELPNGDLQLTVSKKIKMTDYNMEPPVMFLGTIKVGDEISLSFDFELKKLQK
jgi:polyisoprenoid-binding protein YceI